MQKSLISYKEHEANPDNESGTGPSRRDAWVLNVGLEKNDNDAVCSMRKI